MQLTHSPLLTTPSMHVSFPSPHRTIPDLTMYLPTLVLRALASKQPRVTPTLSFHPVYLTTLLRESLRLNETFVSFRGNLHNSHPLPPIFSALRRPIHSVLTNSTLSYRSPSEHIYFPPLAWFPTVRDNNQIDLVIFYKPKEGRESYILLSFF